MADIGKWVRDFYASVHDEEAMCRQLEALSQHFDANYIALQFEGGRRFFMMSNRELGMLLHHYEASDFENPYIQRGTPRLMAGGAVRGSDVVSQQEVHRSAFYSEIMRPVEVEYSLGGLVWQEGGDLAIVSINRPRTCGDFSRKDGQRLQQLLPDMRVAIDLHLQFRKHLEARHTLEAALDATRDGLFWLDRDGVLLRCNAPAQALLDAGYPVFLDGRRHLRERRTSRGLAASTASSACQTIDLPMRNAAGTLTHWGTMTRLSSPARYTMPGASQVMVKIRDLRDVALPPADLLQRLFRLTPRESEVCLAFLQHAERKAVAHRLVLAPDTVKTHMANIYRKTGCKDRSQLVRLLERLTF